MGVTDNSIVTPGQILFRLDPEQYRLAVAEAEAHLAGIGQMIGASTASVDVAQARVVETKAVRFNVQDQATSAMELVRRGVYAQDVSTSRRTERAAPQSLLFLSLR